MQFDAEEFDAQQFDPNCATEEQCWAAIPHLEGALRANTLNHLGGLAYEREDFAQAAALADQAGSEWRRLGHDDEAAKCFSNAGSCLNSNGETEQAIERYKTAAEISSNSGNEEFLSITNHAIGCLYKELYDFENAIQYFTNSLKAAENANSKNLIILANEGLGICYMATGNPEIALDLLGKACDLASQEGKMKHAAALKTNIAFCHQMMNQSHLAVDEISAARELALLMNDHPLACERGNQLSELHRRLGNYELAIEIAHTVKETAVREKLPKLAAIAGANIGHALNLLGQHEAAYQQLTTAAEILKMGGNFAEAVLAEADAAHAALAMNNIPLAQLRLDGCEKTSKQIELTDSDRMYDLNDRDSMLSLVKFQLELEMQLATSIGTQFEISNPKMAELFSLENKAAYPENQSIVNAIVALKPEFIVKGGQPELMSPAGELLTKTLAELIDEKYFEDDPAKLARFHELQAQVRNDLPEANENLALALTYYIDAGNFEKAYELSAKLQNRLKSRPEISRARTINSRIY